jgi:hypothetical protein
MYVSECWAMKNNKKGKIKCMSGDTMMDKVSNKFIRVSLKVAPITEN